ncbi:MAG TPA: alpha/beta hydrolase [Chthoniobacter sp.]|nr:alpha/beta hydrolase [Chthoniobacter sp.]
MTAEDVARRPSKRSQRSLRILLWLGGAYLIALLVLVLGEDRLAFPGWTIRKPWLASPAKTVVEVERIAASDGNTIEGWWLPAADWTPEKGAVLYLHGNGQNISTCGKALRNWRNELKRSVLGIDYPGFGHSTGTPNERSCYVATQAALDWIVREKKVPARNVVVIGQSMGGAMAIEIASRQRCRLLVTSGAFTSFPDIAQYHYGWLPACYLVRSRFGNLSKMHVTETPVFIAHGTDDHTVPFTHGERLYAAATGLKRFYPVTGHGHSQPDTDEFYEAVRTFLRETSSAVAN